MIRPELVGTETAALGSVSIISTRSVLIAAHVLYGHNNHFQINFFVGTSRRSFQSNLALIHENYVTEDYNANDIGLIFLQGRNYFSVLNIIAVSMSEFIVRDVGTVTGYGFVSEDTIGIASLNRTVAHILVYLRILKRPKVTFVHWIKQWLKVLFALVIMVNVFFHTIHSIDDVFFNNIKNHLTLQVQDFI